MMGKEHEPQEVAGESNTEAEAPETLRGETRPRHTSHQVEEPVGEALETTAGEPTVRSEEVLAELLPETEGSEHDRADQLAGETITTTGPIQDRIQPSESEEEVRSATGPEAMREGMPEDYPGEAPERGSEGTAAQGTPPGTKEGISRGDEEAVVKEREKGTRPRRVRKQKAA